ncbi:MAG TPA: hypothetical protein VIL21_09220, partial [Solirubrobacterales bacterium]
MFAFAARAQAEELLFWDNYSADPDNVVFSSITGSGGGTLNFGGAVLNSPEGIAYDPVTNRIYVASASSEQILFANLDGSGGGVFAPIGAPIENPLGVAIDPVTRMIYWVNGEGPGEPDGSVAGANLDTGAGSLLNTTGATVKDPYRIALDTVGGRVYWTNENPDPEIIGSAAVNGSGGSDLSTAGATPPKNITGLAVDEVGRRLYWIDDNGVGFASLGGGAGGNLDLTGSVFNGPYGMAVDPTLSRVYWANYSN